MTFEEPLGECLVCSEKFYDETAYRQYVAGERHTHKKHDCGYPEDSFACKIRHIQINTGDANSKRSRWDQAADRHNEHHF